MDTLRFSALEQLHCTPYRAKAENGLNHNHTKITSFFGSNVFNSKSMREYLSEEAFKSLMASVKSGSKIDRRMAGQIAAGMKTWAMDKGVSHYTHWFQPLTGTTAEKHDSFFSISGDGTPIENFDGDSLVQQEPDASSFPSGGLRATFEARGYTAWDPSSPAFIIDMGSGKTLCVPTVFISYTGESLDFKGPLLKAIAAVDKAATDVCNYFDKNITRVTPTLGWEQEYFLIDARLADARPDLLMCERTVIGHPPAKGQQLEDHYFGTIPERAYAFMRDLEIESYKLGIPLKTRHNEVAPAQFECAPIYEDVNIAVDHNSLLMDVMNKVALHHEFRVLLHEKPFAGINGSGKHNNWSMSTDTGVNLLSPGKTPKTNLMFLTFFINTIKAVYDHADVLRAAIASAGNDYRLGANEAPPAIISVFIGRYLHQVLNEIETRVDQKFDEQDEAILKLDLHRHIPEVLLDNTDRNRTSPFAFTGNKFEFRAVGSSANCASAMTALNTIIASTLTRFKKDVDAVIEKGEKKEIAILQTLQRYIVESKDVLFDGDGYGDEWVKEAEKRGLANVKTTPHALEAFVSPKAVKMFHDMGIYTEKELHARYEILLEDYVKKVQIDARVIGDLCTSYILPCSIKYQNRLIDNIRGLKEIGMNDSASGAQRRILTKISEHIQVITHNVEEMIEARKKANKITDTHHRAVDYCEKVKPFFDIIRYHCDKLEFLIDDDFWKLPKYRELLFLR
ncbi:MAG TPA: glutamine synthetase III [Chitinophagaceae bacterium]|jgi:glutamine synthetase|nr:glutamine synthetase III [Chitinophagaceae bacterium]